MSIKTFTVLNSLFSEVLIYQSSENEWFNIFSLENKKDGTKKNQSDKFF